MTVNGCVSALGRRKTIEDEGGSKLARVLTLLDLSALGVGSTLGLGVYVLAGSVAKFEAGPAVCLSFLVAAIASAFAGLCYAEFAARVPKAGSAYIYSYVSVGEFVAYIIGWNLILEYVIGTASVARGLSNYIDSLAGYVMRDTLTEIFPIDVSFLSPYPDFFSFVIILLLAGLLAYGVKESTNMNNVFTTINLIVISIVIVAGSFKADPKNWQIPKESINATVAATAGEGGFLPFGFAGVMAGAAKCFFGFVGFDCVATTGEEAKKPQRNIPLAIIISLVVIFFAYFGISTVLTMMWPYYDQDPDAPLPYVFGQVGMPVIMWIVTIGAIFALCTSLLGAMFPLPRILYAMANDGLLFMWLARVNEKTRTPILATIASGILAGIMATIFNLQQLIDMMSIGTLLAYTIVAICVLILKYQNDESYVVSNLELKNSSNENIPKTFFTGFINLFNLNNNKYANYDTSLITKWGVVIFCCFSVVFCGLIIHCGHGIFFEQDPVFMGLFAFVTICMIIVIVAIARQPIVDIKLSFKVPFVPILPCLSIIINIYLMMELDMHTWIRFVVWLIVGFCIYFGYGLSHSQEKLNRIEKAKVPEREVTKF